MRRRFMTFLFCACLCTLSESAPADGPANAGAPTAPPDVLWNLHVLYLPGSQDARLTLTSPEGTIAVRAPWQCVYKRTTFEQQDIVKIKCMHGSGAVVGTVAMCRREVGQSDLEQLSIGVDGVAAYETIDLSCLVPREHGRGDEGFEERK
jgi:hypothetical protein